MRWRGGGSVGRLAVIDVKNAVTSRHGLHAVGERGVAHERVGQRRVVNIERLGDGDCYSRILRIVRPLQSGPAQLGIGIDGGRCDRHNAVLLRKQEPRVGWHLVTL